MTRVNKNFAAVRNVLSGMLLCAGISPVLAETPYIVPAPGKMVAVGDHRMHLNCRGSGSPTVILESGLGGNSLDWSRVLPGVAEFVRVCAYDRAGYGWSEMGVLPRTSLRIATELHDLLHSANEPPPYILVGHSFGGYSVRLFASRFPEEAAALVLVDASHEQQFRYFREIGQLHHANGWQHAIAGISLPDNLPAEVRKLDALLIDTQKAVMTLQSETRFFQISADQTLRYAESIDIPVTVLSRGRRVWPHNAQGDRLEAVWQQLQDDLFNRLGSLHRVATRSGHYIQLDEPDIVIHSIRELVRSARQKKGS